MKKNTSFTLLISLSLFYNECSKKTSAPTISTLEITNLGYNEATTGGNITDDGGSIITERGLVWSESANPTTTDHKITDATSGKAAIGKFSTTIKGLQEQKTYHARAYASNAVGLSYGIDISFTTLERPHKEGDYYHGGTIFQTDGVHGLIASGYMGPAKWGSLTGSYIGTSTGRNGAGWNNTVAIVQAYGTGNYAAKICSDYSVDGYTNWYLPSSGELQAIASFSTNPSNPQILQHQAAYWSSSEDYSKGKDYAYYSLGGYTYSSTKDNTAYFVAVSEF